MPFKLWERLSHLPIWGHASDSQLLLDDGSNFAMIEVQGATWETRAPGEVQAMWDRLNHTMKNIASPNIILTVYQCRLHHSASIYPGGKFRNEFSRNLDGSYKNNLLSQILYDNRTYVGIQVRPGRHMGEAAGEYLSLRQSAPVEDPDEERMDRLTEVVTLLMTDLRAYRPRRLGIRMERFTCYSEIAEAIVLAMTGAERKIPLTTGKLGEAMFSEHMHVLHDQIVYTLPGTMHYGAAFGMKHFPTPTVPGMFANLLASPYRSTTFHYFRFIPTNAAQGIMKRKTYIRRTAEDPATEQTDDLGKAVARVGQDFVMGDYSFTHLIFANTPEALDDTAMVAWSLLADSGLIVAREVTALESALFSIAPGNARLRPRPGYISSKCFTAMAPLHAYPKGEPADGKPHWGGPVTIFRTRGGIPYKFHLHVRDIGNTFVCGRTGSGKAQPLDAKILTPTGWRQMGDLKVGDPVTCPDGRVAGIVGVFPQGPKDIYRVTFEDGRSTRCCAEHIWKVWWTHGRFEAGPHATRKQIDPAGYWVTKTTAQLQEILKIGKASAKRVAVPLVAPFAIEQTDQTLPIPPYVLGALLGDGSIYGDQVRITSADQWIISKLGEMMPDYEVTHTDRYTYGFRLRSKESFVRGKYSMAKPIDHEGWVRCGHKIFVKASETTKTLEEWAEENRVTTAAIRLRVSKLGWTLEEAVGLVPRAGDGSGCRAYSPLMISLQGLGLLGTRSHTKFIPQPYKTGSVAQRLEVLRGLMDTDGSVGNGTHATFTSTSERLARDVQEIAWSLGAKAKINPRQTYCSYLGKRSAGKPSWRVSIVHPDVSQMFSLPKKVEQCKQKTMRHRLHIQSVEFVGKEEAQCIAVDHPDYLYVTDDFIVTHNTTWLGFVISQAERLGATTVLFDKDYGLKILVNALGGTYLELNVPTGLAPLKALTNSESDLTFLGQLMRGCIMAGNGKPLTEEEQRRLRMGLETIMELPPEERELWDLRAFLGVEPEGAGSRLEKWCRGNEFGGIIDNERDVVSLDAPVLGFDQTKILDNQWARGPVMATLYHYVDKLIDGRRLLFVIDEFWKSLQDESFRSLVNDKLRTLRKQNSPMLLSTQSPKEALDSAISTVIKDQCPTQIFFGNSRADPHEYGIKTGIGLTSSEIGIVKDLDIGQFLLKQDNISVPCQLLLDGMEDEISILSTGRTAYRVFTQIETSQQEQNVKRFLEAKKEVALW